MKGKMLMLLFLLVCMAGPAVAGTAADFAFDDVGGTIYRSTELLGSPVLLFLGSLD